MADKYYRLKVALDRFQAPSGRRYSCIPGTLIKAPEGDFADLAADKYEEVDPAETTVGGS